MIKTVLCNTIRQSCKICNSCYTVAGLGRSDSVEFGDVLLPPVWEQFHGTLYHESILTLALPPARLWLSDRTEACSTSMSHSDAYLCEPEEAGILPEKHSLCMLMQILFYSLKHLSHMFVQRV